MFYDDDHNYDNYEVDLRRQFGAILRARRQWLDERCPYLVVWQLNEGTLAIRVQHLGGRGFEDLQVDTGLPGLDLGPLLRRPGYLSVRTLLIEILCAHPKHTGGVPGAALPEHTIARYPDSSSSWEVLSELTEMIGWQT